MLRKIHVENSARWHITNTIDYSKVLGAIWQLLAIRQNMDSDVSSSVVEKESVVMHISDTKPVQSARQQLSLTCALYEIESIQLEFIVVAGDFRWIVI